MRASQTQDKFIVRLPNGMREQISEAAAANNRSMTAEIVARLTWSFEKDTGNGATGLRFMETARNTARHQQATGPNLEHRVEELEAIVAILMEKK